MFPMGWFMHFCVRGRNSRHFVNVLFGTVGITYFFGWEVWQVYAMTFTTWMLMRFLPRDKSQIYVTFFVFGFLSASQILIVIYRFGGYDLEITTHTMLLTLRLQALGWSYYDGGREREELTPRQKHYMVEQLPSILEIWSFAIYFSQFTVGVFVEYRDFICWIEEREEYMKVPNPVF